MHDSSTFSFLVSSYICEFAYIFFKIQKYITSVVIQGKKAFAHVVAVLCYLHCDFVVPHTSNKVIFFIHEIQVNNIRSNKQTNKQTRRITGAFLLHVRLLRLFPPDRPQLHSRPHRSKTPMQQRRPWMGLHVIYVG